MTTDEGTTRDPAAAPGLPSDPAQIEQVIAQRRAHLASTIDELSARARPKEIARRSVADAKARMQSFTRTEDGALRTERLAAIGAAVAVVVTALTLLRRRAGRSR